MSQAVIDFCEGLKTTLLGLEQRLGKAQAALSFSATQASEEAKKHVDEAAEQLQQFKVHAGLMAEAIRADADRQREVILANAYRDAQKTKGEGDARSAGIYARAFSENAEFYAFYRSMEAYRSTFRSRSDVMLLEPNSDFFRYLKDASGRPGGKK